MFSYLNFRSYFKLTFKPTSIFGSYRFLRIPWHDSFSLSDHFQANNALFHKNLIAPNFSARLLLQKALSNLD